MKLGLIGIGRLGTQLAKNFLLAGYTMLVYHYDENKLNYFIDNLDSYGNIEGTKDIKKLKKVDVILLSLPNDATLKIVENIKRFLGESQWVVNTATEVYLSEIYSYLPSGKVVSAKIIGNASEIEKGEEPTIVVDGKDDESKEKTIDLFSNFGYTIEDREMIVTKLNKIGAIEAVRTVLRIEKRLAENNVEIESRLCKSLLNNVVAGTIKAYSKGNTGPFLEQVIKQLKKEKF